MLPAGFVKLVFPIPNSCHSSTLSATVFALPGSPGIWHLLAAMSLFAASGNPTRLVLRGQREIVTRFTRHLATLLTAKLPLVRCLETLARQQTDPTAREVFQQVAGAVRAGGSLSEGLSQFPRIFDPLLLKMIRAAETGGILQEVLVRLATYREKAAQLRRKVQTAMVYPLVVLSVALAIVVLLILFVVPRFQAIYQDLPQLKNVPLPLLTQAVISISQSLQHYFPVWMSGLVFCAVLGTSAGNTRQGRHLLDWLAFQVPLAGVYLQKLALARIARTLGTLLASGVPILEALRITREISGNHLLEEAFTLVHDRVRDGATLGATMEHIPLFPPLLVSMIQVGEETGALSPMLERASDAYDEEIDHETAAFTSIIEPLLIVLLALVVGTIVIALFLPIIDIIQNLGGR